MSIDELIQSAVRAYGARLGHVLQEDHSSAALSSAVRALVASLEAAVRDRAGLKSSDCPFSVADLIAIPPEHRALLLNEYALGLGRIETPVVVMGTEHAYELERDEDLVNFCLESCAEPIVLLADGSSDLIEHLSMGAVSLPDDRPFHVYPNDHYREGGTHTWARLSRVVGDGGEHRPGASPGLGDLCYQIELSAFPSQRSLDGRLPSEERIQFLEGVMPVLAQTARVLLFHGKALVPAWMAARDRLIKRFLGGSPRSDDWVDESERIRPLLHVTVGSQRVIVTRALANAGVTAEFLDRLSVLVHFRDSIGAGPVEP